MAEDRNPQDPYAPPARHKDKSGPILRVALLAAMLGAAAWGYTEFTNTPSQGLVAEQTEEQQVADAGYELTPEAIPQGAPSTPAAPAEAAPRTPAPAPSEPVPPPSTTITP